MLRRLAIRSRYDNFIGGKWDAPVRGQYFENISPITGKPVTEVARSTAEDIELALDAAHAAREKWGRTWRGKNWFVKSWVKRVAWICSLGCRDGSQCGAGARPVGMWKIFRVGWMTIRAGESGLVNPGW